MKVEVEFDRKISPRRTEEELNEDSFVRLDVRRRFNDDFERRFDKLVEEIIRIDRNLLEETQSKPKPETEIRPNPQPIRWTREKYELYRTEKLNREKIGDEELKELVQSLKLVVEDLPEEESAFRSSLERWIDRSTEETMIRGNLQPFTSTGDINDAIFPKMKPELNFDSWKNETEEDSEPEEEFSSSWPNQDASLTFFRQQITRKTTFDEEGRNPSFPLVP